VTDGAHVDVGLCPDEIFLRHCSVSDWIRVRSDTTRSICADIAKATDGD
jgi:hypothetical protein